MIDEPKNAMNLNLLGFSECSHGFIAGQERVRSTRSKREGEAVNQAQASMPQLIGLRGCYTYRIESFNAKSETLKVVSAVGAKVNQFFLE
jgi:hypothetical protein